MSEPVELKVAFTDDTTIDIVITGHETPEHVIEALRSVGYVGYLDGLYALLTQGETTDDSV
jgi:hypothetical protein